MAILPECRQLQLVNITCAAIGLLPADLILPDRKFYKKIYKLYTPIPLILFLISMSFCYVKFYELLYHHQSLELVELCRNVSVTLITSITLIRQLIVHSTPKISVMFQRIIESEKRMLAHKDKMVVQSYLGSINEYHNRIKIYAFFIFWTLVTHLMRPFYVYNEVRYGNETINERTYALTVWHPFEERQHFWAAYLLTLGYACVLASMQCFTDMMVFSLIIYPVGQLKILYYTIINFKKYKEFLLQERQDLNDEQAATVTFRTCIDMHRDVIRYIDDFNECMNMLNMFDFIQTSIQICAIISQVIVSEMTPFLYFYIGAFFLMVLYRLVVVYYYANEIILLSADISRAVWTSNWYEQPKHIRFMMRMMMLRCKRPLMLKIGPFGFMSLSTLISILRTTYSYFMLVYTTQTE